MRIGIIGTGKIASGVGQRLVKAGHEVFFGSRDPEKAQSAVNQMGAQVGSQEDAVSFGDIIVLPVPLDSVAELSKTLPGLRGKIIIETANDWTGGSNQSSTERIQALLPDSKVVKAFNHIFAQVLANDPANDLERSTAFIAGDDADAKKTAASVIESMGFDVVDVGGAKNAVHLDNLVKFVVEMGYGQGIGTNIAFKLVKVY